MFTVRWRLFRLLGIPISVDASWLLILALLTSTIHHFFERSLQGLPSIEYWLMGLIGALAFFACIVLHELGHATVARNKGIPIRGITLFLFGGVAEMGDEPPSAMSEFLMAIGGPIVSVVLAALFWGLAILGAQTGWAPQIVLMLQWLAGINFTVLIFNMIPAFPLDGGRVLRSILWGVSQNQRRATRWAALLGQGFAWLLIIVGAYNLVAGLQHGGQEGSGMIFSGIWLGIIGLFLNNAAKASYQQVIIRQALQGEPVRRFMNPNPIVVPPNTDLRSFVEDYVYRYHRKTFPVASNGHLEGYINTQVLSQFPRTEWDLHTVEEVMRRDVRAISIPPDTDALQALGKMQKTGSSRLLVTEDGRLLGIVSLRDLLRFLHLKMELESYEAPAHEPPQREHESERPEPPVHSHT
jgi:Zn-dependent protease/CBS domain-containing protein